MTDKSPTKRRIRISIRIKMLLVISAVLSTAIVSYLLLATSLFERDKIAYIYDLNSSLAGTLSEQTRSSLDVLLKEASLYVRDATRGRLTPRQRRAIDAELFAREPDILRIEILSNVDASGSYVGRLTASNKTALEELGLGPRDLMLARKEQPLPLAAIAGDVNYRHVQNSSLPPDAGILTVAFQGREGQVVAVDFRHDRLLRIFRSSELYETFLIDERGQVLAHPDKETVIEEHDRSRHVLVKQAVNAEVEQGATEFRDAEAGVTYIGAYSSVGFGRLWVLSQIAKAQALRASEELKKRSILFAIAIFLASFLVSIFFSRILAAPIRKLRAATEDIGKGRFDIDVSVNSRDEIGELAVAFTSMAHALRETQAQLVQSEKMAAFGQLGAGITHEVKNPMTGIVGFAQLAQRKVANPDKTLELLKLIEKEGLRCRDILVNFLKFARASEGAQDLLNFNRLVEEVAGMLSHQLNINKVKLDVTLADSELFVNGNGPELQQVLMNLAINAQQAMDGGGQLTFTTTNEDGKAVVRIADNGPGIPKDIQAKIFEPFFTTKESGEGTGLGLSVSFGIIQSHKGLLSVDSEIGKGTTFTIQLPVSDEQTQEMPVMSARSSA